MIRKLLLPALAASLLAGCATHYGYRGGAGGDYYYGSPGVEYRYVYPYGGWGHFDAWLGRPFDFHGSGWYGHHGHYGYFGGYRGYPHYPPRRWYDRDPRHDGRGRGGHGHGWGGHDDNEDGASFAPVPGAAHGDDARPFPRDGKFRGRPLPHDGQEDAATRQPRRAEQGVAPRPLPQRATSPGFGNDDGRRSGTPRPRGKARPGA